MLFLGLGVGTCLKWKSSLSSSNILSVDVTSIKRDEMKLCDEILQIKNEKDNKQRILIDKENEYNYCAESKFKGSSSIQKPNQNMIMNTELSHNVIITDYNNQSCNNSIVVCSRNNEINYSNQIQKKNGSDSYGNNQQIYTISAAEYNNINTTTINNGLLSLSRSKLNCNRNDNNNTNECVMNRLDNNLGEGGIVLNYDDIISNATMLDVFTMTDIGNNDIWIEVIVVFVGLSMIAMICGDEELQMIYDDEERY